MSGIFKQTHEMAFQNDFIDAFATVINSNQILGAELAKVIFELLIQRVKLKEPYKVNVAF